jgi:hypothetical protein
VQANRILRPNRPLDRTAAQHFQEWLAQHGQQATDIDVSSACTGRKATFTLPLPCPQLRSLALRACTVQLATLLQGCAGTLTRLRLQDCSLVDTGPELEAAPALTSLRHLDFSVPPSESYTLLGCLLSGKPQLTHLRLGGCMDASSLQELGSCRELQELVLAFHNEGPHGLPHVREPVRLLATSLTKLSLASTDPEAPGFVVPEDHPISRLIALQSLDLTGGDWMHPGVLQRLTGLTALSVINTPLCNLPDQEPGNVAAAALLLTAVLPRLQRLRQLSLRGSLQATAQLQLAAPAQVELQEQEPPAPADDMDFDGEPVQVDVLGPPVAVQVDVLGPPLPLQADVLGGPVHVVDIILDDESDADSDVDDSEDGAGDEQPAAAAAAAVAAAEAAAPEAFAAAAAEAAAPEAFAAAAAEAAAPAEAFAALTFPTLELLDLADCSLPAGAPAHMF